MINIWWSIYGIFSIRPQFLHTHPISSPTGPSSYLQPLAAALPRPNSWWMLAGSGSTIRANPVYRTCFAHCNFEERVAHTHTHKHIHELRIWFSRICRFISAQSFDRFYPSFGGGTSLVVNMAISSSNEGKLDLLLRRLHGMMAPKAMSLQNGFQIY